MTLPVSTFRPQLMIVSLALAFGGPHADAQAAIGLDEGTEVEGFAADPARRALFHFRIGPDSMVTIDDLGLLETSRGPLGGAPTIPDSAVSSIRLHRSILTGIASRIDESHTDNSFTSKFGFGIQSRQLRIQFEQGLPIWVVILTALSLLCLGGAGVGITLTRRERRRRREDAAARQRALHAREAERTRIAREIHDGPLQDVHALRLLSGSQTGDVVGEEAGRIARELRAIAEGLRPPALGRFGLAAALSAHANRVKERYRGVSVGLDLDEDGTGEDALPDVVRSSLFRIAQEAITNAIEHGRASHVNVHLRLPEREGDIILEVADDGAGLPWSGPHPDLSTLADEGHFGLVGMHERVAAIGGTLSLSSGGIDGRGAHVRVTLPDMRRIGLPERPHGRSRRLVSA